MLHPLTAFAALETSEATGSNRRKEPHPQNTASSAKFGRRTYGGRLEVGGSIRKALSLFDAVTGEIVMGQFGSVIGNSGSCECFAHARVLAELSGFPSNVKTRVRCFTFCRNKTA
jgi:hypothetical protein